MVIYADILFLINFVSAYIMLSLIGKFIVKSKIKIWRLCIASAVGGISAAIIFSWEIPIAISYFFRLLSALIMVFISFYEQKHHILSQILWLTALSGMMIAAMVMLTAVLGRTTGAIIRSGVVYFDLPQKVFIPLFVLSYILVTLFIKFLQRRRLKRLYIITVTYRGKKITVPALFDSGNLLREPVTGKAVSIIEWNRARELLDTECEFEELVENISDIKLWAVPYHSVGNKSGILLAFAADSLEIHEENRIVDNTLVGLYKGTLSDNNEYNALLNAAIF